MTAKAWALAAALALLSAQNAAAQESSDEQPPPPPEAPQAEETAPEAKPAVSPQLEEYLADTRDAAELSDDELRRRIRRGQTLMRSEAVAEEAREEIRKRVELARAEQEKRVAAAQQPAPQPEAAPAEQQAQDQPQETAPAEAKPETPAEVAEFLADARPSRSLSDDELKTRLDRVRTLLGMETVPGEARAELRKRLQRAQAEEQRRASAAAEAPPAEAPPPPGAEPPQQDTAQAQPPAAETAPQTSTEAGEASQPPELAILRDRRPSRTLSDDELRSRIAMAEKVVAGRYRSKWRRAANNVMRADTAELQRRSQVAATEPSAPVVEQPPAPVAEQPPEAPPPRTDQQLDANPVSQAAEASAGEFIAGSERAASLNDDQLEQRLAGMRELLQRNEVSPRTKRLLRRRLAEERDVLRARVARREAQQEAAAAPAKPGRKRKIDFDTNITVVLGDRRRSDELEDEELRRRIDVYRDAMDDEDYQAEERDYWRRTIEEDRRALRARMLREREERARDYRRRQAANDDFDVEFDEDAPRRASVWAAEADDDDIEDALVAAPRRKVQRRYTIDDIERDATVRAQMPALEIDTVRFGFNEAFLREEEIARLDRIAGVIEKILAARPKEVFLVEGHTDAVGSDAYNLDLSRKRARAVKDALTAYYVIPPKSLETVGYGERYLKIPTAEEEPENRRVSLRRVTPFVGER